VEPSRKIPFLNWKKFLHAPSKKCKVIFLQNSAAWRHGGGQDKVKNETARAQKIFLGCGAKGNFLCLRLLILFQKWNLSLVNN